MEDAMTHFCKPAADAARYICLLQRGGVHLPTAEGRGTCAYCRGEGYICLLQRGGVHLPTAEGRGTRAHCRGEGYICLTAEGKAQPVLQVTDSDLGLWSQVITQDSQSDATRSSSPAVGELHCSCPPDPTHATCLPPLPTLESCGMSSHQ